MNVPARITAFTAALAAVFAFSLWLGHTVGPDPATTPPPPSTSEHGHDGSHR
ncbi:hypothetical protein [Mycolicibacterium sp.]|uniref:hypothetical protein n=1 Tax=Mycolicibacterium sp. TaxID=2320850 RepID=UPI003D13393C